MLEVAWSVNGCLYILKTLCVFFSPSKPYIYNKLLYYMKRYLLVMIALVIGMVIGLSIKESSAAPITTEIQGGNYCVYETIYVNGQRYIIFSNKSNSDIEVVKY